MTQIKKTSEFQGPTIEPAGKVKTPESKELAQRKDIVELHNRLASMLSTLNQALDKGTTKKAEKDRSELVAKLDCVETAVNKMEGTLRIELEPMLRELVTEAVSQQQVPRTRPTLRFLVIITLFISGLAVGTLFPGQIKSASIFAGTKINEFWTAAEAKLPLNGGSRTSENQSE